MQDNGTHYISMNISLLKKTERERTPTERSVTACEPS